MQICRYHQVIVGCDATPLLQAARRTAPLAATTRTSNRKRVAAAADVPITAARVAPVVLTINAAAGGPDAGLTRRARAGSKGQMMRCRGRNVVGPECSILNNGSSPSWIDRVVQHRSTD